MKFFNNVLFAASWTNEEIDKVREMRKTHARLESDGTLSKDQRREHGKQAKACTIIIEYLCGTGRFSKSAKASDFPPELETYMYFALNALQANN
ncbi:hypothetical protein [Cereibacter changlensis]|uniref:hypothetical protein n=1 Tax=Cereibacter changlensis TaxID=402884 RepID=UPI004034E05E